MAGRIRDSDIAEVRDRCRIDIVVGEYVNLGRAGGGTLKGLCPFHDEKTASFNVRPSKGTFHCFGCGVGGDVIQFIQQYEHIGFVEAVERLADGIGYRLTYTGGGATVQRDRGTKTRMLEAHKAAAQFYMEQLHTPDAVKAREFLAERGFDQAAADRFGCGFAPAGWDRLTKHLIGRGFEMDELYKSGLAKEGRQGPIDRFHRRLLWPLKDLGGEVVGFGARRIFPDDPIEAKYVNTSETPIFKKSHVLFGIDLAKREIARRHQVVVVEGYTDVMAMHLSDVPTAVASCGTAFGADHISVLRRLLMDDDAFRGEVIFTFDGDAAGQKAALKAFDDEQKFAAQTFIAIAPDGMDPCELRQSKGDMSVRDLVARRQPLFAFAIRTLLAEQNLETAEGRVEALRRTVPLIARIKEVALRDEYARQLAGWVGWDDIPGVLRRVRETAGGKAAPEKTPRRRPVDPNQGALAVEVEGPARPSPQDPQLHSQREVLKSAIQLPGIAGPAYDSISEEAFTHPAYLELHQAILAAGGTSSGLSGATFVDAVGKQCKHTVVRSLITELSVEPLRTRSAEDRYVHGLIANLQANLVARQIADIKSRLQRISPVTDADEYRSLFGDLVALEQYHKGLREQAMGGV